jgi:uncharacterized membrane protein
MDTFIRLADTQPVVLFHLLCALAALLLGIWMLIGRKGSSLHRWLGWLWVALMSGAALSSVFILDRGMPNVGGYTPIHLLTIITAVSLVGGIRAIRRGQVVAHSKTMRSLFWGACVVAGAFTLLPSRFLGRWLWHDMLGWAAA